MEINLDLLSLWTLVIAEADKVRYRALFSSVIVFPTLKYALFKKIRVFVFLKS
jgi:hypothetical protein